MTKTTRIALEVVAEGKRPADESPDGRGGVDDCVWFESVDYTADDSLRVSMRRSVWDGLGSPQKVLATLVNADYDRPKNGGGVETQ